MSSKKKKRREEFLKREAKRRLEKEELRRWEKAIESGDIEEMAAAFGIKLR